MPDLDAHTSLFVLPGGGWALHGNPRRRRNKKARVPDGERRDAQTAKRWPLQGWEARADGCVALAFVAAAFQAGALVFQSGTHDSTGEMAFFQSNMDEPE